MLEIQQKAPEFTLNDQDGNADGEGKFQSIACEQPHDRSDYRNCDDNGNKHTADFICQFCNAFINTCVASLNFYGVCLDCIDNAHFLCEHELFLVKIKHFLATLDKIPYTLTADA